MADYLKPVVFKLGKESYGVDINLVSSIEKQINIVPVPNSLKYIKGIINLRGEVIPVFSLRKKFNLDDVQEDGENLIIVKLPDMTIALEVDEVDEIHDFDKASIVDMPAIVKNEDLRYFDRVANIEGRLIVLLDIQYFLSEGERQTLKKMTEDLK